MSTVWVGIEQWLDRNFDRDDPVRPAVKTVRAWCRDGKLYPAPRKQGRAYFLAPNACYVDPASRASLRSAKRHVDGTETA